MPMLVVVRDSQVEIRESALPPDGAASAPSDDLVEVAVFGSAEAD